MSVLSKTRPLVEVEGCLMRPSRIFEGTLFKFAWLYVYILPQNISVIFPHK